MNDLPDSLKDPWWTIERGQYLLKIKELEAQLARLQGLLGACEDIRKNQHIEKLEAELKIEKRKCVDLFDSAQELKKSWAAEREKVARLKEDLLEFGRHSPGCSYQYGIEYRCRCGWLEFSEKLEAGLKAERSNSTLNPEKQKAYHHLMNLLACIHSDGGHYASKWGLEKAVKDAESIILSYKK